MQVEILVETTPGTWEALDTYGDVPAMNFQINDFLEIKDRQASYSQAISLPVSDKNCRLFGFANIFEARSMVPYVIRKVAVYVDGVQIVGPSFRIELRSVETDFKCQIVSNVKGLFDTLANTPFTDTEMEPFYWTADDVDHVNDMEGERLYLQGAVHRLPSEYTIEHFSTESGIYLLLSALYPYYSVVSVAKRIFESHGYELDYEPILDSERLYFSLPKMLPQPDSFNDLTKYCIGSYGSASFGLPLPLLQRLSVRTFKYNELSTDSMVDPDSSTGNTLHGAVYTSPGAYKMRFNFKPLISEGTGTAGNARMRFRVRRYGLHVSTGSDSSQSLAEIISETSMQGLNVADILVNGWTSEVFEISPGETVFCEAYLNAGNGSTYFGVQLTPEFSLEDNVCGPGCKVYPAHSTAFKTQNDFIKMFIQLYGLFIDVDTDNRKVRVRTLKHLINNIESGNWVDWTDKLDMASVKTTTFSLGSFAQENRILFKTNETLRYQEIGIIFCDNANIVGGKDLFTLDFESTKDVGLNYDGIRYDTFATTGMLVSEGIIFYSYSDISGRTLPKYIFKPGSNNTQIVRAGLSAPVGYRYVHSGNTRELFPYFPKSVSLQNVADTFYGPLQENILKYTRVIEEEFNLSPADIENIDLLKPVYLGQYGDYFYIQKIANYQAGALTKVSLVCLNTAGRL